LKYSYTFKEPTRVPHLKIILLFLFAQDKEMINSILNTFGTHIELSFTGNPHQINT